MAAKKKTANGNTVNRQCLNHFQTLLAQIFIQPALNNTEQERPLSWLHAFSKPLEFHQAAF